MTRPRILCVVVSLWCAVAAPAAAQTGTATSAPTAKGASCGGEAQTTTDGTQRPCTFDDEFDGSSLDLTRWTPQTTAASGFVNGGTACFVDSPNTISVADGVLNLTARREDQPFKCTGPGVDFDTQETAGMVTTWSHWSQAYGRFEVRAKLPAPATPGLQETLWLWPQDPTKYGPWPGSGEIDFAEFYSLYSDRVIPYIHYNPANPDSHVTNNYCMVDIGNWHTYWVEWSPLLITIGHDDTTCVEDDWMPASPLEKPEPFNQPFILALTQALGFGLNNFDPDKTPLPATTSIDWVRVWK